MIQLLHPFKDRCIDIDELLSSVSGECREFNRFCYNIDKQSNAYSNKIGGNNYTIDENIRKYKGWALEIFAEFFIKYHNGDNRIGIVDYQPITIGDTGVDGIGKSSINGQPATVQVKYRQFDYLLTANEDHLSNFFSSSFARYFKPSRFFPEDNKNMLIITSGAGLHHFTENDMFVGLVRCINRQDIRVLVDNLENFWIEFKNSLTLSRIPKNPPKKIELRQHQKEISNIIINSEVDRGIIELPTGCGKTYVQADIISRQQGFKVIVILSPRILLSFQHLRCVAKYLQGKGINAEYLNVNSGTFDDSEIVKGEIEAGFEAYEVKSTTSSTAIKQEYERVKPLNRLFIISSTYHSVEKIKNAGIVIDLAFHDEAHHLVSEEFGNLVSIGVKNYYFTATPRDSATDSGWGMNNKARFGETLCLKTPKEMIEAGEMMPPALHIVTAENQEIIKENDYGAMARCIFDSYNKHEIILKSRSAEPSQIAPKLLISVDGQKTLKGILDSSDLIDYRIANPNVNILAISSDVGIYINGQMIDCNSDNKEVFFDKLRSFNNDEKLITLYVDMLTEGIDVPGITGFMPLRSMGDDTLKQGIGRACRLYDVDRIKFYNNEISPNDFSKYIKRYAWVIVPEITTESTDYISRYQRIVDLMYSYFGFDHTKVFIEHQNGLVDPVGPLNLNDLSDKTRQLHSDINKFVHTIEEKSDRKDLFANDIKMVELIIELGAEKAKEMYTKLNLKDQFNTYIERAKRWKILAT